MESKKEKGIGARFGFETMEILPPDDLNNNFEKREKIKKDERVWQQD